MKKVGGGMKETTFWEFKRKLERKKEEQGTAMIDKDGKLVEGPGEILKVYKDFYKDLFKDKVAKTIEEKEAEESIGIKMKEIESKGNEQAPIEFEQEEVNRAIRGLKCRKASDCEKWINDMIRKGGEEMAKSIRKMFNKILRERDTKAVGKNENKVNRQD